ncbi:MAG TPA: hypothetical protein VIY08_02910 [Candidatus Nitrosocosmicus sp.]
MKNELEKIRLQNKGKINFIGTTAITGTLTTLLMGPVKNLITEYLKGKAGKFVKEQFREKCTEMIKDMIISQLRGKFATYLTEFIVAYIEKNIEKLIDNQTANKLAEKITNNIVKGLGTFLFSKT